MKAKALTIIFLLFSFFLVQIIAFSPIAKAATLSIGELAVSDSRANVNDYLQLNVTVASSGGVSDLKNSTLGISNGIIYSWDNATDTFSEEQDTNSYSTLGSCTVTEVNATALTLTYNFTLSYVDQWDIDADDTKVFDTSENSESLILDALTNNGFETGDGTGWALGSGSVESNNSHSGTYS